MKKRMLILLPVILLFFALPAKTQETRNELNLSFGMGTLTDLGDAFSNIFADALSGMFGDGARSTDTKSSGLFMLTYQYHFSKVLSAGPAIGYEKLTDVVKKDDNKIGEVNHQAITFAAEGRINYLNLNGFGMYLALGAGAVSVSSKASNTSVDVDDYGPETDFTFHVTGLGIRAGNALCATAELGFGYRGIFNLGVSYRF